MQKKCVCVWVCVRVRERDGERLTFNFPGALLKHTDRGLPAYAAVSMWLLPSICSRAGEGGNRLVKNMPAGLTTARPHCQNGSDLTYGAISAPVRECVCVRARNVLVCVWGNQHNGRTHCTCEVAPCIFCCPPPPTSPANVHAWLCASARLFLQRLLPVWAAPLTFRAAAWRSLGKNSHDCGDCGCVWDSVALKGHTRRSETGGGEN